MHLAGPLIATTPRLAMTSTPNQPPPSDALDELYRDFEAASLDRPSLATAPHRHEGAGPVDWSAALAGYEAIRTLRTARVQRTARVWGDIWHVDGLARQMRNEPFADHRPDDFKHVEWLCGT